MKTETVQWCTLCGERFTEQQIAGVTSCPSCNSNGIACRAGDDVRVSINWHELRIMGIWASNYAETLDKKGGQVLSAILMRLQNQFPDKPPLTLFGEVQQLKSDPRITSVESNVPNASLIPVNGPGAVKTITMRITEGAS